MTGDMFLRCSEPNETEYKGDEQLSDDEAAPVTVSKRRKVGAVHPPKRRYRCSSQSRGILHLLDRAPGSQRNACKSVYHESPNRCCYAQVTKTKAGVKKEENLSVLDAASLLGGSVAVHG